MGEGLGSRSKFSKWGNLGTRTLGSEIQDSLNIVCKKGVTRIAVGNGNPFVFILENLVLYHFCEIVFVSNSNLKGAKIT